MDEISDSNDASKREGINIANKPLGQKRRRRYMLLLLLVLVSLVAVYCATAVYQIRKRIVSIEKLNEIGGVTTRPVGPEWLRSLVGERWMQGFDIVEQIDIDDPDNGDLALLANLPEVAELTIRCLGRENCRISDRGLDYLAGCRQLRELYLNWTDITSQGLEHLRDLTELQSLGLSGTHIDDDGLTHLSRMKNLKYLSLESTSIDGSGFRYLSGLQQLEHLDLGGSPITDDSLKHLVGLPHLKGLDLSYTSISDTGINTLKKLSSLTYVDLQHDDLTYSSVKALARSLPDCYVKSSMPSPQTLQRFNTLPPKTKD